MGRPRIEAQRREEILSAFEACVVRSGLANTTLNDVAEEVGQPRSLVRYFLGNRDEMVARLIDRMVERHAAEFESAWAEIDISSPDQIIEAMTQKLFSNDASNRLMTELRILALRDEVLRERIAAVFRRAAAEVALRMNEPPPTGEQVERVMVMLAQALEIGFLAELGVSPGSVLATFPATHHQRQPAKRESKRDRN